MLTAHRYNPGEIGLSGPGGLNDWTDWLGPVVTAAVGIGSNYSDAIKSGSKTACGVVSKAGGPAAALLAKMSGASAGDTITQGMAIAAGSCSTLFPTKPGVVPGVTPTPTPPTKKKYPAGTVHYFDAKTRMYMIAMPKGGVLKGAYGLGGAWTTHGFGGAWTTHGFGDAFGDGLGAATHNLTSSATDPSAQGSVPSTKSDVQSKTGTTPIYKQWWFWVAIAGGTAALGTGGYLIFRRK